MKARAVTVGQVMTRDVLSLTEEQDLRHVEDAMRLFKFRHMPVTADGRLVGLVTQRDLLRASASSLLPGGHEQTEFLEKTFRVRDIMTSQLATVQPETPLTEAARLMQKGKLGCLPVTDSANRLVGILTEADFVRLALDLLEGRDLGDDGVIRMPKSS